MKTKIKNLEADIDWEFIVDSIRTEKTILFLGPGVDVMQKTGDTKQSEFFRTFHRQNLNHVLKYHKQDNLLIFKNKQSEIISRSKIKNYFKDIPPFDLHNKLADLPFHLYISLSPDNNLTDVFEEKNLSYSGNYYDRNIVRELENPPTKSVPLVYNLFGTCNDADTLVVSHQDLFALLKSMSGTSRLPMSLRKYFTSEKTNNLIFLGVEFDKWYFPYLLSLLELDDSVRYASDWGVSEENKILCFEDLKINFISNETPSFVDKLHHLFKDELRKPLTPGRQPTKFNTQSIRQLLKAAFGAAEFEAFCIDNYPQVHQEFTVNQNREQQINLLIDNCQRENKIYDLLRKIKEANSIQYENYQPYFA